MQKQIHIVLRSTAKAMGFKRYFPASVCVNGHCEERRTSDGSCIVCKTERGKSPDVVASRKIYAKKHYLENKVEKNAYAKTWRDENKEKMRALQMAWRQKNPDRHRANQRAAESKRRARCKTSTPKDLTDWASNQKKVCHWCSKKCDKSFHVDHYHPISKGGKHEAANWVISCPRCNTSKCAKDPYLFAKSVGRLF